MYCLLLFLSWPGWAPVWQEVVHEFDIEGVGRVQWVPTHDDEIVADHEVRISALEVRLSAMQI